MAATRSSSRSRSSTHGTGRRGSTGNATFASGPPAKNTPLRSTDGSSATVAGGNRLRSDPTCSLVLDQNFIIGGLGTTVGGGGRTVDQPIQIEPLANHPEWAALL